MVGITPQVFVCFFFFFNDTATTEIYTLSLHDALPIFCGLEEGLLPHSGRGFDDGSAEPSAEGVANLEEERRLAYVGMTRARERLTLTRAAQRLRRGKLVPCTPSRFLDDLPAELVDLVDLSGPASAAGEAQTRKARSFFADMDALLSGKNPEGGER